MRISPCNIPSTKLQIRQEDVHSILKHMHRLRRLNRPRIVHDWYAKPLLSGFPHCLNDLRDIVCRRHKIDIVGLLPLKLKKYLSNPVESREASLETVDSLDMNYALPETVETTSPLRYRT